jgi:hypothetical protein
MRRCEVAGLLKRESKIPDKVSIPAPVAEPAATKIPIAKT